MAKDTGKGSRKGSVKDRTQVKNPKTSDFAKRNETKGSSKRGEFMDNKKGGKPFKASPKSRTSGAKGHYFVLQQCPICGLPVRNAFHNPSVRMNQCECSRCGSFAFDTYVGSDFRGSPRQIANASSYIREHQCIAIHDEDVSWLKSLPTPTVAEKSINLLRGIAAQFPKAGSNVRIQISSMQPQFQHALNNFSYPSEDSTFEEACFDMFRWLGYAAAEDPAELAFIIQCVLRDELGYLEENQNRGDEYQLTGKGWQALVDAERTGSLSEIAFVGMSFDGSLLQAYQEAIQPAITSAGYRVDRLDHTKHNEEIVHKILADIRRANFVVVDLTLQNHGAYFEAGFAMGLGRPVIRTVRKDELGKVHFDQRQYNFLRWDPTDLPQFRYDLQQWIEGTVGRGPLPPTQNSG